MLNFRYYNPVRIVFGKGTISELANLIPKNKKILMIYGGGSIKKNGVYEQVKKALKGYKLYEFKGIEPNPLYETCMEAVALIKKEKMDFLLAVGGGSVLDATKFIAAAAKIDKDDPWGILLDRIEVTSALPFGSILTLPATGSEMNSGAVISRKSTKEKLGFGSIYTFPQFSIVDPETTYSLPMKQIANGIVDAYVHVVEQYVTNDVNSPLQDRQAEAILKTLLEIAPKIRKNPRNYEERANLCWCSTQALNGLISCGVVSDWATHMIGHELTAFYGIDHAQSLAIILPRVWLNKKEAKAEKLLQYAERVFNIPTKNKAFAIEAAIQKTEEFFNSVGVKTKLADYNINSREAAELISKRIEKRGVLLGENSHIIPADVKSIIINS